MFLTGKHLEAGTFLKMYRGETEEIVNHDSGCPGRDSSGYNSEDSHLGQELKHHFCPSVTPKLLSRFDKMCYGDSMHCEVRSILVFISHIQVLLCMKPLSIFAMC